MKTFKPRIVHQGDKMRGDGAVSALCYPTPRAISLKRASYVLYQPDAVTCPKCRVKLPVFLEAHPGIRNEK